VALSTTTLSQFKLGLVRWLAKHGPARSQDVGVALWGPHDKPYAYAMPATAHLRALRLEGWTVAAHLPDGLHWRVTDRARAALAAADAPATAKEGT
jgi:hypothetical protein